MENGKTILKKKKELVNSGTSSKKQKKPQQNPTWHISAGDRH